MYRRYLAVFLFALLIAEPAAAQTNGASGADRQQYRLSGILISETRRIALVDDRTIREGARIGDAVVESIDYRQIQIRRGANRQVIRIGSSFSAAASTNHNRQVMIVTRRTPETGQVERLIESGHEHLVASGETLSGIALRYRAGGATMEQMMLALFNANRHAFGSNLNRLKAAAILKIPDQQSIDDLSPAMAAVAVQQHNNRWRAESAAPALQLASNTPPNIDMPTQSQADTYGPIDRGETLAKIARSIKLSDENLTTNQVMIALFDSNPQAFGSNINVLYEGSVLTLPKGTAVASLAPSAAKAEVQRQMKTWLAASEPMPGEIAGLDIETIVSAEGFLQ